MIFMVNLDYENPILFMWQNIILTDYSIYLRLFSLFNEWNRSEAPMFSPKIQRSIHLEPTLGSLSCGHQKLNSQQPGEGSRDIKFDFLSFFYMEIYFSIE